MKWPAFASVAAAFAVIVAWLHLEHLRGTFDAVERGFVAWLAANTGAASLPPLTLVLFDDEASGLSGSGRMAVLDGALFTRAASRLGAAAAGVEGIPGDPLRMIEAAGTMPVFGGYDWAAPPGNGWTPLSGQPGEAWPEAPGLAGRGGRFARGFVLPPQSGDGDSRIVLAARNGDRAVPSFLALAWVFAHGGTWSDMTASPAGLSAGKSRLATAADGSAHFLDTGEPRVLSMNDLLVAAEEFERKGGTSPFRDHVMVLARATADVTRVAVGSSAALTPLERWASAWEAVRTNRLFLPPGWWYPALLAAAGTFIALGPARSSWKAALTAAFLALLVFALAALGAFGSSRVLLPAAPALSTFAAALVLGRVGQRAGWFGK
jgi:hypothetical protein